MQTTFDITVLGIGSDLDEMVEECIMETVESGCAYLVAAHIINTKTAMHVRRDYPGRHYFNGWDDLEQHLETLRDIHSLEANLVVIEFSCVIVTSHDHVLFPTLLAHAGELDNEWLAEIEANAEDREGADTFATEVTDIIPHPLHLHVSVKADIPRPTRLVHSPYFTISIPEKSLARCRNYDTLEQAFDVTGEESRASHVVFYCKAEDAQMSSRLDLLEWMQALITHVNRIIVGEMDILEAALCIHI